MALGRVYTIPFNRVAITAIQDLWNIASGSTMAFELHSINLNAEGATTAEELNVQIKRMTATVTNGTGGSSATISPTQSTNSNATITGRINDATTQATTNGTSTVLDTFTWQLTNGYVYQWAPEDRFVFSLSQNCVITLAVAPAGSHTCSGSITVAELI